MSRARRTVAAALAVALGGGVAVLGGAPSSNALPTGFVDDAVIEGLNLPTDVAFGADGRVFVAEKRGVIKVFDSLADTTPEIFLDIRTEVFNNTDGGLLGIALDPGFPTTPHLYVTYVLDAPIGGTPETRPGTAVLPGRVTNPVAARCPALRLLLAGGAP